MPANLRDGKLLDGQIGFETGMGGTVAALSCDFNVSMQMDMDLLVDYADLIYSDECMSILQRLVRPMHFDDETLAYDNMEEVGVCGSFLDSYHTLENYPTELWTAKVMERDNYDGWVARGAKDIREVCLEKARELYHQVEDKELYSKEIRDAIDAIALASDEKAKHIKR